MGFHILSRVMGGLTSHHKRGNSDYSHSSPPHYYYHNYDNHFNTHVSKKQKTQPFMDSYTVKSPSLWNKLLGYFKKEGSSGNLNSNEGLREKMVPYYRDHNKGIPVVILNSCRYNGVCENEEGSFDEKRAELLLNYASKGKKAVNSIRNKFLIKDEIVVVGSVDKVIDLDKDNDSDEDEVRIVESGGVNLESEKDEKVGFGTGVIDLDKDDGSDDDEAEIIENRNMVSELEDKEKVDLVNRVIDLDEDETAFIENGGKILPLVKEEKDDLVNEVIDLDKGDDIDDDEVQIVERGGMDMELDNMGKTLTTLSLDSDEDSVSELPVHTLEPFVPLTNEEKDEVFRAFSLHNWRNVLVTHENANIDITGKILHCLKAEEWLNDEVVNVFFHLLKERETREPNKFLKCHFFNTFFYKKLISGKSGYDYKSVRRWTTKKKLGYNLSECDKIFIPIHKQAHWCLAVINKKDRKFQYLDSLGGIDTKVLKVLAMYYADELKDKNGVDIDVFSWTHERVDDIPLQKNGSDCGMFMIKYVDFYSRGLGLCFNQKHMPYFRLRTAKEILRLEAR